MNDLSNDIILCTKCKNIKVKELFHQRFHAGVTTYDMCLDCHALYRQNITENRRDYENRLYLNITTSERISKAVRRYRRWLQKKNKKQNKNNNKRCNSFVRHPKHKPHIVVTPRKAFSRQQYKHRTIEEGFTFKDRNAILLTMGYKTYQDYLESGLWKSIKTRVFAAKGRQCVLCGNLTNILHHRLYNRDTLLGHTIDWIEPVCNRCHHNIEFLPDGSKTNHQQAEDLFIQTFEMFRKPITKELDYSI